MIGLGLLALSAALLVAGAEVFVDNAAGAACRLGVTVFAIGLLLAGAEPEELLTGCPRVAGAHGRASRSATRSVPTSPC